MNNPITRSCIRSVLEKQIVRRTNRLIRVRSRLCLLLQSVDRSLRLPLIQIGACPFPCTPLLSILMLVPHTWREIVPVLLRFCIVAVSMERLQVCKARISMVAIDRVHLNPVVMLEEQPTVATSAALLFKQPGQSSIDTGVSALSRAPVHPVSIVGTTVTLDLHMPSNRHLAVG